MRRKEIIVPNQIYHVCNKSISNFRIFKYKENVERFLYSLDYYNQNRFNKRFSYYLKTNKYLYKNILINLNPSFNVKVIAYCIMPDHYHLLIKTQNSLFTNFISKVENSYSRYFNIKYHRNGPLWQSRYRIVRIKNDEHLLHVTRYIHLNPTSSNLVSKPEDWKFSSYRDYILNTNLLKNVLSEITIRTPDQYKIFVENQIDYQRKFRKIKKLLLE